MACRSLKQPCVIFADDSSISADSSKVSQVSFGKQVSEQSNQFLPGFDSLRLIGALSVLFSHSFLITQGTEGSEPLQQLLHGGKNVAGLYGVFTFFIISGYLLSSSLNRDPDILRFVVSRSLRLLPGFVCCILFSALVIGPIFSQLSFLDYMTSPELIHYLKSSFSTLADAPLPGVFNYSGIVSDVVNGSLWSLRAEVMSYLILLVLWTIVPAPGWVALTLGGLGVAIIAQPKLIAYLPEVGYPLPFFAAGVVIWWLTTHLGDSRLLAQFCGVGVLIGILQGFPHAAFAFFGGYLVIYMGTRTTPLTPWIQRHGDISYGLFLLGWPVQQMLRQLLDLREPLSMFLLSSVVTAVLAWCLFHSVERPALSLRKPLLASLRRFKQTFVNAIPGRVS